MRGPGNLDLEGEETAPKQEMPLWAPAARGQGAGFWAKRRLGYMQGKQAAYEGTRARPCMGMGYTMG